jgi:transglutaminase/protease-like cytokinesis protein 3
MEMAANAILISNPIAAYAVEEIACELGTNSGQSAIAVNITYLHDKKEILKISRVRNVASGKTVIAEKLDSCADSVVLFIENYTQTDFVQMVEDYADENPHIVMETPEVKVNTYPESGASRVVELKFIYQTSRELLRSYQYQVERLFTSAALYVNADAAASERLSQLYSFLMQLEDYEVNTSITPAYSLLRHGQGDSKAFATVYAAMCREAGMSCRVVTGTRRGEAWYWNRVKVDGEYYYLDLLASNEYGEFLLRKSEEMLGYVWDYSVYP